MNSIALYRKLMEDAFSCVGWRMNKTDAELAAEFKFLIVKNNYVTWPDMIKNIVKSLNPKDPIIPCLQVRQNCTISKPCLNRMVDFRIPMNITRADDYVRGMKAARSCSGYLAIKTEQEEQEKQKLSKEYNNLKGAKRTWADIIKNIDPKDKENSINKLGLIPCLKAIKG